MAQPDSSPPTPPAINLDYAFSMRIDSGGRIQFEGQMRSRVFEPAAGGETASSPCAYHA